MRGVIGVLLNNLRVLGLLTSYTAGEVVHQILCAAAAVKVTCVTQGREVHCSRGNLSPRDEKVGHVQKQT